ncbi:hypothetical protein JHK82_040420 [Glycine max]|nr:hypothetical protein JHK86_040611 [Glycine max]KAG4966227.1 hypothetical protein JHK85_041202 [Glycine max]KAG5111197.1 hypothetical protein JHK82_040420 [Glycine max]KAG5122487.1 hypothetical protein JHK84_040827 [Glycine max]
MESLGKEFDLDGNRIRNNPAALLALCWYWATDGVGSKDMVILPYKDSLLLFSRYLQQLVMESLGKEFDLDGNRGTRSALYANNRESITVTVQEVTPRSVGALIALYERAVGIYASLVNINAYHQPGVEAGKKAAGEVLALQKRIEMIYKIIAHMAANDRALIAEGNCGSPRSIKVFLGECNLDELYA